MNLLPKSCECISKLLIAALLSVAHAGSALTTRSGVQSVSANATMVGGTRIAPISSPPIPLTRVYATSDTCTTTTAAATYGPPTTGQVNDFYNLSSCANSNVSMIFRLENTHPEYFFVKEFCKSRGSGMHCYAPRNCTGQATAMVSCPEGNIFHCRGGFGCRQDDPTQAGQCMALIDMLPEDAWNYGSPTMVLLSSEDQPADAGEDYMSGVGFKVTTTGGAVQTVIPTLCRGPCPCERRKGKCGCARKGCTKVASASTCTCQAAQMHKA